MSATGRKHLFVDDRWISSTHGVYRQVPVAEKDPDNPLVVADQPWEGGLNCFGTVLEDPAGCLGASAGNRYRLWYQIYARGRYDDPRFGSAIGYAESADGRAWTKPAIGMTTPRGEASNIVATCRGRGQLLSPAVLLDPQAPPEARYRLLNWDAMS